MNKELKQLISVLLSVCMILSCLSMPIYAAERRNGTREEFSEIGNGRLTLLEENGVVHRYGIFDSFSLDNTFWVECEFNQPGGNDGRIIIDGIKIKTDDMEEAEDAPYYLDYAESDTEVKIYAGRAMYAAFITVPEKYRTSENREMILRFHTEEDGESYEVNLDQLYMHNVKRWYENMCPATPGDSIATPGDSMTNPGDVTPGDATPGDATPGDATPGDANKWPQIRVEDGYITIYEEDGTMHSYYMYNSDYFDLSGSVGIEGYFNTWIYNGDSKLYMDSLTIYMDGEEYEIPYWLDYCEGNNVVYLNDGQNYFDIDFDVPADYRFANDRKMILKYHKDDTGNTYEVDLDSIYMYQVDRYLENYQPGREYHPMSYYAERDEILTLIENDTTYISGENEPLYLEYTDNDYSCKQVGQLYKMHLQSNSGYQIETTGNYAFAVFSGIDEPSVTTSCTIRGIYNNGEDGDYYLWIAGDGDYSVTLKKIQGLSDDSLVDLRPDQTVTLAKAENAYYRNVDGSHSIESVDLITATPYRLSVKPNTTYVAYLDYEGDVNDLEDTYYTTCIYPKGFDWNQDWYGITVSQQNKTPGHETTVFTTGSEETFEQENWIMYFMDNSDKIKFRFEENTLPNISSLQLVAPIINHAGTYEMQSLPDTYLMGNDTSRPEVTKGELFKVIVPAKTSYHIKSQKGNTIYHFKNGYFEKFASDLGYGEFTIVNNNDKDETSYIWVQDFDEEVSDQLDVHIADVFERTDCKMFPVDGEEHFLAVPETNTTLISYSEWNNRYETETINGQFYAIRIPAMSSLALTLRYKGEMSDMLDIPEDYDPFAYNCAMYELNSEQDITEGCLGYVAKYEEIKHTAFGEISNLTDQEKVIYFYITGIDEANAYTLCADITKEETIKDILDTAEEIGQPGIYYGLPTELGYGYEIRGGNQDFGSGCLKKITLKPGEAVKVNVESYGEEFVECCWYEGDTLKYLGNSFNSVYNFDKEITPYFSNNTNEDKVFYLWALLYNWSEPSTFTVSAISAASEKLENAILLKEKQVKTFTGHYGSEGYVEEYPLHSEYSFGQGQLYCVSDPGEYTLTMQYVDRGSSINAFLLDEVGDELEVWEYSAHDEKTETYYKTARNTFSVEEGKVRYLFFSLPPFYKGIEQPFNWTFKIEKASEADTAEYLAGKDLEPYAIELTVGDKNYADEKSMVYATYEVSMYPKTKYVHGNVYRFMLPAWSEANIMIRDDLDGKFAVIEDNLKDGYECFDKQAQIFNRSSEPQIGYIIVPDTFSNPQIIYDYEKTWATESIYMNDVIRVDSTKQIHLTDLVPKGFDVEKFELISNAKYDVENQILTVTDLSEVVKYRYELLGKNYIMQFVAYQAEDAGFQDSDTILVKEMDGQETEFGGEFQKSLKLTQNGELVGKHQETSVSTSDEASITLEEEMDMSEQIVEEAAVSVAQKQVSEAALSKAISMATTKNEQYANMEENKTSIDTVYAEFVDDTTNTVISENVIAKVKDNDVSLVVEKVDETGNMEYQWFFDTSVIKDVASEELKPIDTKIDIYDEISMHDSAAEITELIGENHEGVVVDFSHSGVLPGKTQVEVATSKEFADEPVYCYYYNEANEALEYCGEVIMEDGVASFGIEHCSVYVLSDLPFVEEEAEDYIAGYTLSLNGDIAVNYYMTFPEKVLSDENAYVEFSLQGEENSSKVYVKDVISNPARRSEYNGATCYIVTYHVCAPEMTDTIEAQLHSEYVNTIPSQYSVKQYADYIIANAENSAKYAKAAPLVQAMLNYGGYSQQYFGHNTYKLANDGLYTDATDPVQVDSIELDERYAASLADVDNGLKYYGSSLLLNSKIGLRIYFQVTDSELSTMPDVMLGQMIKQKYSFTIDGNKVTPNVKNGMVYIQILDIAAAELDDLHAISVANIIDPDLPVIDGDLSALSYVYIMQNSTDASMQKIMKALYFYNKAANTYFKI